ncbi:N-acetylmuramic acid 6-phosphate etherase [Enterococcus sp. UD-01]|jgi:N-acetylmuramic acid 6-phosphate etherase|uniref:N-acetylmuramic acid 6-phosphate etherase n=1 Tax=Enterococcus sp. UD-01 TaxID=3373911 RepID=UPI003835D873
MLDALATERRNQTTTDLDRFSVREIVEAMNQEDQQVAYAVKAELSSIVALIEAVVACLDRGGNLFYIGAGTSGRLGVLDAAECIPTFNTKPEKVQGLIAGGMKAMTIAVEGAEDSLDLAKTDLKAHHLKKEDFVLGIAASGRTPYVIGGLEYAKEIGATTGALSCNKGAAISRYADFAIEVATGAEVLTGSTRLKAGTAQKLVLNMISTASMIRQGKAYQNLMVDVQPTNEKLVERAKRIIMEATDCTEEEAAFYLKDSEQNPKLAIVRILSGESKEVAEQLLQKNKGFVGKALESTKK